MRTTRSAVRGGRAALVLAAFVVLPASTARAADGQPWRIERADVRVIVPLKPGGAFTATTTALSGSLSVDAAPPVHLAGEIALDLATIDTGIALRNQHLRENYLEVAKGDGFNKAVLSDIRLGDASGEGFEGTSAFTANLLLHGVKRPVMGTVEIRPEAAGRRVRAEFSLILTDFGVTPPEYLGVGVGSKLLVKVGFAAVPGRPPGR
jgi:polyisoprenoid-binding protein YceI